MTRRPDSRLTVTTSAGAVALTGEAKAWTHPASGMLFQCRLGLWTAHWPRTDGTMSGPLTGYMHRLGDLLDQWSGPLLATEAKFRQESIPLKPPKQRPVKSAVAAARRGRAVFKAML